MQQGMDGGEEGAPLVSRRKSRREVHAETRSRSRSAWLYFPHIELVVLFFAFEGAVAAQLAAVRENRCPWVFFTASTALVSHPNSVLTRDQLQEDLPSPTNRASSSSYIELVGRETCQAILSCNTFPLPHDWLHEEVPCSAVLA